MAEQVELELILKGGAKSVKTLAELEEGLAQARNEIKGLEKGSEDFNKLATAIQDASSEIKTLEKQMEGLEPQQKAEAFLKMGEGIAGGFAVMQGSMALAGVESENLEKIQVKVQSAIAIAQGIRMMSEAALMVTTAKRVAIEKLSLLQTKGMVVWTTAMSAATAVAAGAQKLFTGAVSTTSGAFRILKIAIMSTGIGALVVAIGAMVVGITSWIASTKELSENQNELNDALLKENQAILKNIDLQREKDKAESEEAVRLIELRESRKNQAEIIERNNEAIEKNNELMKEGVSKGLQEKLIDENARRTEGNKIIEDRIILLDKEADAVQGTIDAEKEAEAEEKKVQENRKSRSSGRRERRKKEAEELLTLEQELSLMRIEDDNEREAAKIELDKKNALAKVKDAKNAEEQILLIKEKYALLEAERQQKVDDEAFDKMIEANDKWNEEQQKDREEQEAKQKEQDEKDIQNAKAVTEAKIMARDQLTNAVSGSISELGALFKEGSAAAKTAALTDIAINTGLGFVQGLDIAQKAAKATGPAAAVAFPIFYATQIGAVLSAANKARSIIGAGGGGTPPDNPDTPDNLEPASTGAFSLGNVEQPPMKAFVVESEITDSQAQMSDINRRSTI